MKTAAIIAEYNPFHNGHKYHIEQTRKLTGATHVTVVMSGNFTQRGDVAIVPKHIRTKAALEGGADLVVELPVAFALSSAEQFATGAVQILNALGNIDVVSFGSECGNVELLKEAAGAVHYAQTTDEFYSAIKLGRSYPAALQSAVEAYYTDDVVDILTTPNNTLAVEYIKALNESGSNIVPFTLNRIGAAHDSHVADVATADTPYASASQVREMLLQGKDVSALTPMLQEPLQLAEIKRLEVAILARLRTMTVKDIARAPGVRGGLDGRIFKAVRAARSLSELYFLAKCKSSTMARIRRAVLCCFLGITQSDVKHGAQYIRILGMNDRGKEILAGASDTLPIDTSLRKLMNAGSSARRQALLEERATNIYALAFEQRGICGREFTEKAVILSLEETS